MVILHDAIKTIQNSVFAFFTKKRTKTCFLKKQKTRIKKQNMWIDFFKPGFFSTLIIFQPFFVIFPWSHDLEQVTSRSVWFGVRPTPKV